MAHDANAPDLRLLVNMVIHDLDKPLRVIERVLERIQTGSFNVQNESHAQIIRSSLRTVRRSECMLHDLNDVLSTRTLPVKKQKFHLQALIQDICLEFQVMAKSEGIHFGWQCTNSDEVFSDPELIRRIIDNYLANALNHTSADGSISLEASSHKPSGFSVKVKNTGQSIPEEHIEKIFQPEIQLNLRTNRQFKGHGLGLAFCKIAAQAIGGSVRAKNLADGKGVVFALHCKSDRDDHNK